MHITELMQKIIKIIPDALYFTERDGELCISTRLMLDDDHNLIPFVDQDVPKPTGLHLV